MRRDRRRFLQGLTAVSTTAAVPAGLAPGDARAQHTHGAQPKPAGATATLPQTYMYLTPPEVEFVEAAVARLIPADELGPGAKEAGVAYFIDQQLAGAWGAMARNYRQGPWPEGTPQQGYQSPLAPKEIYRAAIPEVDAACVFRFQKPFAQLQVAQQDQVLSELETGKLALASLPGTFFFNLLLANTIEGFFADPVYGGNRDKIAWKLVGFPGVAASYGEYIERHGVPYNAQPVSIADMQSHAVATDEHGHPKHVLLTRLD